MIGVGVLGCGYWGPKLIRSVAATAGLRMVAACDPKEGRRAFVKRQHPGIDVLEDADELIAREDIHAIWVATPARTHVALARRALEQDKHVLVEKPLATSGADAAELVDLAEGRGLTIQAGHTFLHSPAVGLLRGLMGGGIHGRTCYLSSERINPAPPRTEVSVLWDLAVHDVAIALDLIGQRPESVSASGRGYLRDDMPEAVFVTLELAGGVTCLIHASWMSAQKTRVMKVFGTEATLVYDDLAEPPILAIGAALDNRKDAKDTDAVDLAYRAGEVRQHSPLGPEPLRAECAAFRDAIRWGAAAPNSGRRALEVVEVLEAADVSLRNQGMAVALGGRMAASGAGGRR